MRARVKNQVKAPTTVVVVLALAAVTLYSIWGGAVLRGQKQAAAAPQSLANR